MLLSVLTLSISAQDFGQEYLGQEAIDYFTIKSYQFMGRDAIVDEVRCYPIGDTNEIELASITNGQEILIIGWGRQTNTEPDYAWAGYIQWTASTNTEPPTNLKIYE